MNLLEEIIDWMSYQPITEFQSVSVAEEKNLLPTAIQVHTETLVPRGWL